jgi:LmbE family N-acetylglucosaminyl deacetylase
VTPVDAEESAWEEPTWGEVAADELTRIVVVSPHLDDAVLGACDLLCTYPGSTVVTVFAGSASRYPEEPTPWDAAGGFKSGDDVAALRRREDEAAHAVLEAEPVWLDFVDHQYLAPEDRPVAEQVAPVLASSIRSLAPSSVFLPMGLANPDHVVTHDAGVLARTELAGSGGGPSWFCYEDAGYKHIPGILAWRVTKLFKSGLWPTPAVVPVRPDMETKRKAIEEYKSQLPPLRSDHSLDERLDANVPEQFWRLAPPPRGWELLMDLV